MTLTAASLPGSSASASDPPNGPGGKGSRFLAFLGPAAADLPQETRQASHKTSC
jgi:hypothetical protein